MGYVGGIMKFKDIIGTNNKSVLKEVSNVSLKDTIVGSNAEFVGNITFSLLSNVCKMIRELPQKKIAM